MNMMKTVPKNQNLKQELSYRADGTLSQDYKTNLKEKYRIYNKFYYDNGISSVTYYEKTRKSKVSKVMTFDKNHELIEEERYKGNRRVILKYKNKKLLNKRAYVYDYPKGENILDGKSIYYDENETVREIDYYDDGNFLFNASYSFDTQYYMDGLERGKYTEGSEQYEKFGATCYELDKNRMVILSLYNKKKRANGTTLWLVVVDPE